MGLILYKMLAGDDTAYKCAGEKGHSRVKSKDWTDKNPQWQILPPQYTNETHKLCQGLLQIKLESRFDVDTAIESVDAAIEAAFSENTTDAKQNS